MFEYHESNDVRITSSRNFSDSEIPEPIETWSLKDFEDIVPAYS